MAEDNNPLSSDKPLKSSAETEGGSSTAASSSPSSALRSSAATLLSAFATPSALSDSLASSQQSANAQKGRSSGAVRAGSSATSYDSAEAGSSSAHAASSSATATQYSAQTFRNIAHESAPRSLSTQEQFDNFTEFSIRPASSIQSTVSPARYLDVPSDGSDVLAFLSSSSTTEQVYSAESERTRPAEPTLAQLGYNRIVADIMTVTDPVEYLLSTNTYTQDVWGDEWPELVQAKKDLEEGKRREARERAAAILGRIKARL
ncbi:uncharacterized protein V1518DRAFT_417818 [Limtongia smithiae]|uniref:uncharacterized protein n=1 Tax=Limtongia smithiae TaxID=1125753 RepID=UPI0034CF04B7